MMNSRLSWYLVRDQLKTVESLAALLGVNPAKLFYLARSTERYYFRDEKPKPDGRIRVFHKPLGELKTIQKLVHRKILRYAPCHKAIHSYRKGRDQVTNATLHVGKSFINKSDIEDFFPSITLDTVRRAFRRIGCSHPVAQLLSDLCTFNNQLPQGPPTSPGIANQVIFHLARRIEKLASSHGLTLSLFGDDVFISGSKRAAKIKNLVCRIIEDEGFRVNKKPHKSKVLSSNERQLVTGIVVNQKPNVSKDYRRKVRAIIHNCLTKGSKTQFHDNPLTIKNKIKGMVNHIKKLNPRHGEILESQFNLIEWESQF